MQNVPVVVALSQSADPHLQLPPSLAEVPSVILQDANIGREQVLDAAGARAGRQQRKLGRSVPN